MVLWVKSLDRHSRDSSSLPHVVLAGAAAPTLASLLTKLAPHNAAKMAQGSLADQLDQMSGVLV